MKAKVRFLSLAEELVIYILSFLPSRDILSCTSVGYVCINIVIDLTSFHTDNPL
jgi:hypothetical protein